jgi:SAM-dependent methyltransferase
MSILDKKNLLPELHDAILELGCGPKKRHSEAIGIDRLDFECVDLVGDIYEVLKEIGGKTIRSIHSYHFLEHVNDLDYLMEELARILIPGGMLHVVVPHFSNPYFYSDYTHKNRFGLYSFSYFSEDLIFRRTVPHYGKEMAFELIGAKLVFKSSPPFYFRYALKKLLQAFFNLNRFSKEFYEENCCYMIPCYEIDFLLRRKG